MLSWIYQLFCTEKRLAFKWFIESDVEENDLPIQRLGSRIKFLPLTFNVYTYPSPSDTELYVPILLNGDQGITDSGF